MSSSVRAVSGQCRGSVGAVSGQCRLTPVSGCRAVSGQCRGSVGQCRGFLTVDLHGQCRAVSECRSVGVSGSVGVSECRSVETLRASLANPTSLVCRSLGGLGWPRLSRFSLQTLQAFADPTSTRERQSIEREAVRRERGRSSREAVRTRAKVGDTRHLLRLYSLALYSLAGLRAVT